MPLSDDMRRHGSYLSENVSVYEPTVQDQLRQAVGRVGALTVQRDLVGESLLQARVTRQSMVLSFENEFRWLVLALTLGLFLVLFAQKARPSRIDDGCSLGNAHLCQRKNLLSLGWWAPRH